MITSRTIEKSLHYNIDLTESYPGLNSVFAAAVVNRAFSEMLLKDPEAALQQGYLGKGFALSQEETAVILSASANSLSELAQQVILTLRK
jgi:hypothetical protein